MKPIRVLIIDDSAFARKAIREVLSRDPEIEVLGVARDGLDGVEKIGELRPDVVTLDLIMPQLDGMGVLQALRGQPWAPKFIIVSVSGSETELALEALQSGAIDVVAKPTAFATDRLYELSDELIASVKTAAQAKQVPPGWISETEVQVPHVPDASSSTRLVVIGTSTGGPQALTELFKTLPAGLPVAIAVALHIPAGYTASLAQRISRVSAVNMVEAQDGMELLPGQAVIAPGGQHLSVRASDDGRFFAVVSSEPLDTDHHPSVDVLFQSAAACAGESALGLILTGMGDDGLLGCGAIRRYGGKILAESASSCVVYGMPRTVIEAGLANGEAPLENMSRLLVENIFSAGVDGGDHG